MIFEVEQHHTPNGIEKSEIESIVKYLQCKTINEAENIVTKELIARANTYEGKRYAKEWLNYFSLIKYESN